MKLLAIAASLLFTVSLFLPANNAIAAGTPGYLELSVSTTSVSANGTSKVTGTAFVYVWDCGAVTQVSETACSDGTAPQKMGLEGREYSVAVSGSDNTIGGTYTSSKNGKPTVKTGSDGKATFTVASTKAEAKTIQIFPHYNPEPTGNDPSKSVTFTTPAAPKPKPAPAPAPAPEPTPPETPKTASMEVAGQAVSGDKISIQEDESLTLKGTTVANGIVKLFIFSDPKEATVTADAAGNWTYAISGLEPGDHHVEAEVTDPSTNKTSARATLANFAVTEKPVVLVAAPVKKQSNYLPWLIAGGAVVLAAGAGVTWWLLKRKKHATAATTKPIDNEPTSTPPTTEEE